MFKKIMTPVDMGHRNALDKALTVSADLARHYGIPVVYVGITSSTPSSVAHNPEEFAAKFEAFVKDEAERRGVEGHAHTAIAHDPTTEVDDALMKAIGDTGADLVVMQSHLPNVLDYIWPSNGGKLAEHAKCSVMVVRD